MPRSSFYAALQVGADGATSTTSPARRGPKPAVSDAGLLAAIRADLARSPWTGEGHRKVWARLRALDGRRVSQKRVLRLMRQHALPSPHRARTRPEAAHERRIITEAPDMRWATDATQIGTVADGTGWLFGVAEHWNAELRGGHVAKHGTRFEALQALGLAVRQRFGHLGADAPSGCFPPAARAEPLQPPPAAWRCATTTAATSCRNVFQKQIRFWGMAPSCAFVAEPETNGVIERLVRTLKEQAIIEDVRDTVRAFAARYNAEWLIEKNGYRSPADMRAAWQEETFRRAA